MTKAELKKSHDALARFLREVCRNSDKHSRRDSKAEALYQKALKLLKAAGVKYVRAV